MYPANLQRSNQGLEAKPFEWSEEAIELFPFIQAGHPFYPQMQRFRAELRNHPRHDELLERMAKNKKTVIHTEVKGLPIPDRGWRLDRFYWSFQSWDATRRLPFEALTLLYKAKKDKIKWSTFPQDANLTTMASFFEEEQGCGNGRSGAIDVLRYVPQRRLTFRMAGRDDAPTPIIGKFKRRTRFKEAYDKLITVFHGVEQSTTTFSVGAPRGIDEARCLYFQEAMPGENLAAMVTEDNFTELMHRVGVVHREVHSMEILNVPVWDFGVFLRDLQRDVRWIAFFRPEHAVLLDKVQELLVKGAPRVDPSAYVFCHGDFVCSQILASDGRWSVTDFDLCRCGDPYLDMAILMTSLAYDIPLFQEQSWQTARGQGCILEAARQAYLAGYQDGAQQPLDQRRLLWYCICAELYYLALTFKKGWFGFATFDRAFKRACELTERWRQGGRL